MSSASTKKDKMILTNQKKKKPPIVTAYSLSHLNQAMVLEMGNASDTGMLLDYWTSPVLHFLYMN